MTEHVVTWFESEDGKIFKDEMECIDYELNLLYEKSGVRIWVGDEKVDKIITEDDKTYNDFTDIYIDRSKEYENAKFGKFVYDNYGWLYIPEAIEGDGTHYRFNESDESFVKVE